MLQTFYYTVMKVPRICVNTGAGERTFRGVTGSRRVLVDFETLE